jgi:hypothetical protein
MPPRFWLRVSSRRLQATLPHAANDRKPATGNSLQSIVQSDGEGIKGNGRTGVGYWLLDQRQ